MNKLAMVALLCAFAADPVFAKLPAPSDEAKAKAAEVAAKTAWSDKVGLYKLCQAMDRSAEKYHVSYMAAGKAKPVIDPMPACADPGPFVAPVDAAASKPLEAAGAHSPAGMAVSPPSNKATAAEMTSPRK